MCLPAVAKGGGGWEVCWGEGGPFERQIERLRGRRVGGKEGKVNAK